MVRYLSLDWIDALNSAVGADGQLRELARDVDFGITQIVTDGPEGDVVYHLQIAHGSLAFGPGPANPEHVSMEQSWQTAADVATGALNAQEAFMSGQIVLRGDQARLLDAQPVFAALDPVFQTVKTNTDYS